MRRKDSITRDKIIKNALQMFAQKGFFKTTVDDIAGATGVAKGTVYLYFKDKQDLYIATMDEHFNSALALLAETENMPGTPSEKMHRITNEFINYIMHLRTNYMPFTFENLNLTGKTLKKINTTVQPKVSAMIEIISRIIQDGIDKQEFREVDPRLAAFHFLSTIRAIFFSSYYLTNNAINTENILELFFEGLNKRR
ncbi:MAG: TetR/AcrR family transcriptional regulator [candidate division WOR-3 bacterium]|nr:MAG: TetR/AcrR family transcriptional regulator [candidate division WOR-3 bacterium]